MPSDYNKILIAWASSLIFVIGGTLLLEATYTPDQSHGDNTPAQVSSEEGSHAADPHAEEAKDTHSETKQHGDHAADTDETDLPAPGQPAVDTSRPAAISAIPQGIPVTALPELLEESNFGPLPKIAKDGRKSYDIYAAPRVRDRTKSRIAILVTDLGKKSRNTKRAVDQLPKNVSLAFSVYGSNLHDWGQKSRAKGHEVLLAIPMEPVNYPQNDPGPLTLLTSQTNRIKVNLLRSSLGKFSGYVGVVNYMGSRFTASSDSIRPVLDELKRRGLMFVDNRDSKYSLAASMAQGINMPWAVNNNYIDNTLDSESIAAQLIELEKRARAQGTAMGIARPYPVSIRAITVWAKTLDERGFALVPVTSIANQQALPR